MATYEPSHFGREDGQGGQSSLGQPLDLPVPTCAPPQPNPPEQPHMPHSSSRGPRCGGLSPAFWPWSEKQPWPCGGESAGQGGMPATGLVSVGCLSQAIARWTQQQQQQSSAAAAALEAGIRPNLAGAAAPLWSGRCPALPPPLPR
eukprot:COSAG04_NODE_582_length_12404_cov_81.591792_19_plen_146_part_00